MEELVMESGPLDPLTIEQDGVSLTSVKLNNFSEIFYFVPDHCEIVFLPLYNFFDEF